MTHSKISRSPTWIGAAALLATIVASGGALASWKKSSLSNAAAAGPAAEPSETVIGATAELQDHQSATTAIGTVLAMRSVTLRSELPGTVRRATLTPGQIVEAGTVLVALDVAVELADLKALEAQAVLTETTLARLERLIQHRAVSVEEVDRARAERDVAQAEIARVRAIIERKTIRAPFRARIGLSDVHPGQYLSEGTELTTLQGVESGAHVDFTVAQDVAAHLRVGHRVSVFTGSDTASIPATIIAIDARVDPTTRNAVVRAGLANTNSVAPGASVRVRVPLGPAAKVVAIPVSALRKGPGSDFVFVIAADSAGKTRAHQRPVRAGDVVGDEVVILEGLEAGEQVAASGSFKLREGVLVAVASATDKGNGSK